MNKQTNKISKALQGLIRMFILCGLVIGLIVIINWLSFRLQQNTAQQYNSIEAVKKSLGVQKVLVPVYIPESISWPPSLIIAQNKPFFALVMEFKNVKTKETQLFIIQSSSRDAEARFQKIYFTELKEETEFILKGGKAVLMVGICEGNIECSKMVWEEDGIYSSILYIGSSFELIKIADSMIR